MIFKEIKIQTQIAIFQDLILKLNSQRKVGLENLSLESYKSKIRKSAIIDSQSCQQAH